MDRESTPGWRGPAKVSDGEESGAIANSQSRTFKKAEEKDVEDVELDPLQTRIGLVEAAPRVGSTLWNEGNGMDVDAEMGIRLQPRELRGMALVPPREQSRSLVRRRCRCRYPHRLGPNGNILRQSARLTETARSPKLQ